MELRKLKDKASEAFTKGRFSKAAELYEDYCRAEPKDHQSRLRSGDAWVKAGQRDRAISAYQSAAEGFAREGFLPRAIAASKLILELDPAHRGVQQMLADLYARRGTPMGARARGPMSSASSVTVKTSSEPAGASRLPEAVRAAVAAIDLGERGEGASPAPLAAGGPAVDLSAELPPELSLSTNASTRGTEEVVHSVEVGLASEEGTAGVELTLDVEPVVAGTLVDDACGTDSMTSELATSVEASTIVAASIPPRWPSVSQKRRRSRPGFPRFNPEARVRRRVRCRQDWHRARRSGCPRWALLARPNPRRPHRHGPSRTAAAGKPCRRPSPRRQRPQLLKPRPPPRPQDCGRAVPTHRSPRAPPRSRATTCHPRWAPPSGRRRVRPPSPSWSWKPTPCCTRWSWPRRRAWIGKAWGPRPSATASRRSSTA